MDPIDLLTTKILSKISPAVKNSLDPGQMQGYTDLIWIQLFAKVLHSSLLYGYTFSICPSVN